MNSKKINQAAEALYKSRTLLKKIAKLPNDCIPKNKDEAYLIQDSLIKKYLSLNKGASIIGKKIGCTNKAAQAQINVKEPFYGNLLSKYSSKSNCTINSKDFFSPFIEPEFSFKIEKELNISNAPHSTDEIYKSLHSVLPSIEIVDSRFNDWTKAGINNLIADNAVNAYWIYGNETKNLDQYNFSDHSVALYKNNNLIVKGNSSNVMKNPLNSISWLINTLALQGKSLPKNSYISTGTCTPAIAINKDDIIHANFGKLGSVNFQLI